MLFSLQAASKIIIILLFANICTMMKRFANTTDGKEGRSWFDSKKNNNMK